MSKHEAEGELQQVGKVAVDSGMLVVGDPCMLNTLPENWEDFCKAVGEKDSHQFELPVGFHSAVMVGGFGGDGVFPVYVKWVNGIVTELVIRFQEEEE